MDHNTALPEVARLLPSAVAHSLMNLPPNTQSYVLSQVRDLLSAWEERGVILDPITLETVLYPITSKFAAFGLVLEVGLEGAHEAVKRARES